jgi:hypothetical protein
MIKSSAAVTSPSLRVRGEAMSTKESWQNWPRMRLMHWSGVALYRLEFPLLAVAQTPSHAPPAGMTCSGDKLVWVNTRSHVYNFQGEHYFGSTKEWKLICERATDKEGDRPTHNGQ